MPELVDFLDLTEAMRASEASVARLFADAGSRIRFNDDNPQDLARLARATDFLHETTQGRYSTKQFVEAMTTSDFGSLFGVILQKQLYGSYAETTYTWPMIARRTIVPDFRTVERYITNGAEGVLSEVAELTPYPEASISDDKYSYAVKKYGRKIGISWEALINDDLGAFLDIPNRLGKAARRSEEDFVTRLFVDTSGPHASLYTSGNANIVTGNPALSIAGLQTAMTVLGNMIDSDSEPIDIEQVTLVVPPSLRVVAQNILNATALELTTAGGTADGSGGQRIHVANWMRNGLRLAVNYRIPRIATIANGATSWFLFADPAVSRPAIEIGFLRGHERPEVFEKMPDKRLVGGGEALESFDIDVRQWEVRHVFGGSRIDGKATVASNGSGS